MLIPSIDLMGRKIVQLVQGRKKALEFDNFDEWVERFSAFPLVQLIDLDAAIGTGDNRALIGDFVRRLPCQVGGGIRTIATAQEILALGARRVILGSSLIHAAQPLWSRSKMFLLRDKPTNLHGCRNSNEVVRSPPPITSP